MHDPTHLVFPDPNRGERRVPIVGARLSALAREPRDVRDAVGLDIFVRFLADFLAAGVGLGSFRERSNSLIRAWAPLRR